MVILSIVLTHQVQFSLNPVAITLLGGGVVGVEDRLPEECRLLSSDIKEECIFAQKQCMKERKDNNNV